MTSNIIYKMRNKQLKHKFFIKKTLLISKISKKNIKL